MADAVSPQALSNLIGSIYDCALDPSRWDQTLAEVRDALDCQNAALRLSDLRRNRFLITKTVGIEPYWLAQHAKYLAEIHGKLAENLASWPSFDEPHVLSRHVTRAFIETSPFVQEFLKPQGIVDNMMCFLMKSSTRLGGFAVARHERQGIITDREVALTRLLLPHLRRAVMISNVLDVRTIERSRMAEALDALRCAVVLTNAHGTILHANRAAEHMLHNGGPIKGAGGTLRAKAASAAAELRCAIGLAAQDEAQVGKIGLAIRVTEPEAPAVFAHVLPLTGGDLRTRLQPAAVAAVFIGAPPDEQDGADATAAAFGLTPAETRVLASLLAGRTLAETATTLGIAATTAKTHLDNIFSKTAVTRQADLMRLGTGLVPPTKSGT
jgi:DNA-binding CsgD family transcriptional regulator/PAS domain-containing protein